jgi:hypothetical protein
MVTATDQVDGQLGSRIVARLNAATERADPVRTPPLCPGKPPPMS